MHPNIPESAQAEHDRLQSSNPADCQAIDPLQHLAALLDDQDYDDPAIERVCCEIEDRVRLYPEILERAVCAAKNAAVLEEQLQTADTANGLLSIRLAEHRERIEQLEQQLQERAA